MKRCKLCDQYFPKLAKSHIIPKSVYNYVGVKDATQGVLKFDFVTGRFIKSREGEYDQDILCVSCENLISKNYENDAIKVLYQKNIPASLQFKVSPYNDLILGTGMFFQGLNYHMIKMFFVSILWRAHASKREIYSSVNLVQSEASYLKQCLVSNNSIPENRYPIIIFDFSALTNLPPLISPFRPLFDSADKVIGYQFLIGRTVYFMYFDIAQSLPNADKYSINEIGEMRIMRLDETSTRKLVHRLFGRNIYQE